MDASDAALDAAVRAVRGESALDAVHPALDEDDLARIIACAPDAHRLVRVIAALCGGLPPLLDQTTVADPAFHDTLARRIGTRAGRAALRAWVEMAPVGWGASSAHALIDAVQQGMGHPGVAAALIGAYDASAALLSDPDNAAFAIRRWGHANAAAPSVWATALAPAERDRLIATALSSSLIAALPSPSAPGVFFVIAGGRSSDHRIIIIASALRAPGDLACAIALQRCTDGGGMRRACCDALQHALRGRSYDDLPPILALLTDNVRTILMPDRAALARRLACPDHRAALRRALDRLAAIPPRSPSQRTLR